MATTESREKLDQAIAAKERELEALRTLRDMIDKDPGFIGLLAIHNNGESSRNVARAHNEYSTAFDLISKFFKSRNNEWTPASDIVSATGITRSAAARVLYRSHKELFEKKRVPGDKRLKIWRMKGGQPDAS
jgi:hypothetical protein